MASCPFCGAKVPEDLVTYGGNCPKCFAEIPGEEAPTDPGAEVRAIQVAQDRRGSRLKALIGFSLMVGLVCCAGVTALGVVLWPSPEVALLEFDEIDMGGIEFVAVDHVVEETQEDVKKPKPKAVKPTPNPTVAKNNGTGDKPFDPEKFKQKNPLDLQQAELGSAGSIKNTTSGTRRPSAGIADDGPAGLKPKIKVGGGGKNQFDIEETQMTRRKPTLTDEDEIRSTIQSRTRVLVRELNWCYERSLKNNSKLQGRWTIAYTVTKDGRVRNASAKGTTVKNAEFEKCMVGKMNRWSNFYPMTKDRPISQSLRFRPR